MRIEDLNLSDNDVPVEQVIEQIREKKITEAVIRFGWDDGGKLFYSLEGMVNDDAGKKGLSLKSKSS